MAQRINLDTPSKLSLTLSVEQKRGLQATADKLGYKSVSALIGAIGDRKARVVNEESAELLDYIIGLRKQLGGEK